jgi:hypothetical protein
MKTRPIVFITGIFAGIAGFTVGTMERPAARPVPVQPALNVPTPAPSVTDPIARALAIVMRNTSDLRGMAEISTVLHSLNRTQTVELANRLERLSDPNGMYALQKLVTGWARRDPEGATEWVTPRLQDYARFGELLTEIDSDEFPLAVAWAEGAPEKALEYARSSPHSNVAALVVETSLEQMEEKPYPERLAILLSVPSEETRRGAMIDCFRSWASSNSDEALRVASSLPPGSERDRMTGEVLLHLVYEKPEEAFRQYANSGLNGTPIVSLLVTRSCQKDPAWTAQWLDEQQDPQLMEECGGMLVSRWAMQNPAEAFAWARAHGISITKPGIEMQESEFPKEWAGEFNSLIRQEPLNNAMGAKSSESIEWIKKLPVGPERTRYIEKAIEYSSVSGPELLALTNELSVESQARVSVIRMRKFGYDAEKLQEFAGSLPAGSVREAAWREIGKRWIHSLPNMPGAGPDRDAMLDGMALSNAYNFSSGFPRIQQITDPVRRRGAFDDLALSLDYYSAITGQDAIQELMDSPDVPAEWKKPWRQR